MHYEEKVCDSFVLDLQLQVFGLGGIDAGSACIDLRSRRFGMRETAQVAIAPEGQPVYRKIDEDKPQARRAAPFIV